MKERGSEKNTGERERERRKVCRREKKQREREREGRGDPCWPWLRWCWSVADETQRGDAGELPGLVEE